MAINTNGILAALESAVLASGHFELVNGHEALDAPTSGLQADVWVQRLRPWPARSGLAATSARLVLMIRVKSSALQQPQDAIDPAMVAAVDALFAAYSSDFTLGAVVAEVDLLGAGGESLEAIAGWLPISEGAKIRIYDITVPIVINDAWVQAE